jgi:hypothetical protein
VAEPTGAEAAPEGTIDTGGTLVVVAVRFRPDTGECAPR